MPTRKWKLPKSGNMRAAERMNTVPSRPLVYFVLTFLALALSTSMFFDQETSSKTHGTLVALAEKLREKGEPTKIEGTIAVWLWLRDQKEEIAAHGQIVNDSVRGQNHAIGVTDANDIVLIFGTSSVAYFCLTDFSGKLRRVFRAEPGKQATDVAVSEVQARFDEEIAFWKTYLGIAQ
jgi:hypothetical protein